MIFQTIQGFHYMHHPLRYFFFLATFLQLIQWRYDQLDVAASNMFDHNNEEYLKEVETCFENVILALRNRLQK